VPQVLSESTSVYCLDWCLVAWWTSADSIIRYICTYADGAWAC